MKPASGDSWHGDPFGEPTGLGAPTPVALPNFRVDFDPFSWVDFRPFLGSISAHFWGQFLPISWFRFRTTRNSDDDHRQVRDS